MSSPGTNNTTIRLFTDPRNFRSHQVRIVCHEKDVNFEINDCDPNNVPAIIRDNNPYNSLPMLIDRDLVLYDSEIIIDYLEERFPHPPLYSVFPTIRAQTRLALLRIKREWVKPMETILAADQADAKNKNIRELRKQLHDNILATAPVFKEHDFFMNTQFGILDCYVTPLLWRLGIMDIELQNTLARPVVEYMKRMFLRDAFIKSCSREERQYMKGIRL